MCMATCDLVASGETVWGHFEQWRSMHRGFSASAKLCASGAAVSAGEKQMQVVLQSSARVASNVVDIAAGGPGRAVKALCQHFQTEESRREWAVVARVDAIVCSCPRSISSAKSGMRAWYAFHNVYLKRPGNPFFHLLLMIYWRGRALSVMQRRLAITLAMSN